MGGGQPGPADRPMPHYRPAPDYLPAADQPLVADWPPAPRYPAVPYYLSVRDRPPVPDWPAAPATGCRALLRPLTRLVPRHPAATGAASRRAAVLGYLAVPLFAVPVLIYLTTLRGSG